LDGVGEYLQGNPEPGCKLLALVQGPKDTALDLVVIHQDFVIVDGPVGQGQCKDGLMEDEIHHCRLECCVPPGGSVVAL